MANKKKILWSLAAVIAIGGGAAGWQHHRHQQNAAKPTKHTKVHKGEAKDKETTPQPPPPPPPRETVLSQTGKEELAEHAFAAAVRSVFMWRATQPDGPATDKAMLEKFSAITFDNLDAQDKAAWQSLLQSWKALADPAKAKDPQLIEQGQRAAQTLDAMFKAHGDGDITL